MDDASINQYLKEHKSHVESNAS